MQLITECKIDFDPNKVMKDRGINATGPAWKFLASRFKSYCDKYTPFRHGDLKKPTVHVTKYGASLHYSQPYAHYQYYGKVMVGKPPKHYNGASLTYGNGPLRGPNWDKRMMADRGSDLVNDFAAYIGGKSK